MSAAMSVDPIGACTINVFREGWHHAWHFDEAEFTVTLSLQAADEGRAACTHHRRDIRLATHAPTSFAV